MERRRLVVGMTVLTAAGLFITALAPSIALVLVGTAVAGLFSVVAQILVPFAATLAGVLLLDFAVQGMHMANQQAQAVLRMFG